MPWKWLTVSLIVAAAVIATSCSGGSTLPQPGTPGFYWSNAKAAYAAGDYVKTDEELQRILVGDNDYTARARVWDMAISGGLAQGYAAFADANETGAKAARQNPLPYRKRVTELRALAGNMAIQLADGVHRFLEQDKDSAVMMAFTFPTGSAAEPAGLVRITKALFVQDAEMEQLQKSMLQRGVVLAVCEATGNGDNTATAAQLFQAPEVKVQRTTLLFASAKMLQEVSDIYSDKKLDLPNKLKIVSVEALAALKAIPETKDTKAVADKLQKAMKKAKIDGI